MRPVDSLPGETMTTSAAAMKAHQYVIDFLPICDWKKVCQSHVSL
jgi:hypothetical protein